MRAFIRHARTTILPGLGAQLHSRLGVLLPLAGLLAAGLVLAAGEGPPGASETRYLTLLAVLALAGTALLAPPPATLVDWGALIVAALLWIVPAGPERGVYLMTVLLAVAVVAARRRLARASAPELDAWIGLAVAAQTFARSELLLPSALSTLDIARFVLPLVVAVAAAALLAHLRSPPVAFLSLAVAATLGPGFTASSTLPLIGLVTGLLLRRRRHREALSLFAVLVAVVIVRPVAAGLALALAVTLGSPTWIGLGVAAAAAITGLVVGEGEVSQLLWLAVVLPVGFSLRPSPLTGLEGRSPVTVLGLALPLAYAGGRLLGDPVGLLAGLLVVAAALEPSPVRRRVQLLWSALLLAAILLLAAYPWLRAVPVSDLTELLGAPSPFVAALLALAIFVAASAGPWRIGTARIGGPTVLLVLLGLVVWGATSRQSAVVTDADGAELTAAAPSWSGEIPNMSVGEVVVDSSLAHAATLDDGTPVATLTLRRGPAALETHGLVSGLHTGEWAALRRAPSAWAPSEAWIHSVSSTGMFFVRRYRARLELNRVHHAATQVEIERRGDLPDAVVLVLTRVEVRR